MKLSVRCLLCFIVILMFASPSLGQKRRHRQRRFEAAWGAPEVFSNLYLEAETGDVGGMEVILVPSYGGVWATVVVASGIAYEPVTVRVTDDHYPTIEFTLPDREPYQGYGKFTGKITRAGLLLSSNGQSYGLLRRQRQ